MAVRKIKQSWWVDFRAGATRYRKRSPENSRTGAVAYEALLRHKLARGEPIETQTQSRGLQPTFAEFAHQWLNEYVATNNKVSEQRTKKYILNATLIPFFGDMPITAITGHHIEQYKARYMHRGVSNKTIRNRLTVLNKCLATAYEWLGVTTTPPRIKWPKCSPGRTDYLTRQDCDTLLSRTLGIQREMILTAVRTGMRQGELRGLQWSSIDWQIRSLTVRHSRCEYQNVNRR